MRFVLLIMLTSFVTSLKQAIVKTKNEKTEHVENLKMQQLKRGPTSNEKSAALVLNLTYMTKQRAADLMVVVRALNSEIYKMQTKNSNGFDVKQCASVRVNQTENNPSVQTHNVAANRVAISGAAITCSDGPRMLC